MRTTALSSVAQLHLLKTACLALLMLVGFTGSSRAQDGFGCCVVYEAEVWIDMNVGCRVECPVEEPPLTCNYWRDYIVYKPEWTTNCADATLDCPETGEAWVGCGDFVQGWFGRCRYVDDPTDDGVLAPETEALCMELLVPECGECASQPPSDPGAAGSFHCHENLGCCMREV